jgi:hypothetical protein
MTSIKNFCAIDPRKVCNDKFLGDLFCEEKDGKRQISFEGACKLYPQKCEFNKPEFDKCVVSWTDCLINSAWQPCASFPEACAAPTVVNPTFADTDALGKEICNSDKKLFCNGTDSDVTSALTVCDNVDKLPQTVQFDSSVKSFCEQAKPRELCQNNLYGKAFCEEKDGEIKFELRREALQKMYPDKFKLGTPTFDKCAINWVECLLDKDWSFCASFPELCLPQKQYFYKTMDDFGKAICAIDSNLLCGGKPDSPTSPQVVCDNVAKLTPELRANSSIEKFCATTAPWACSDPAFATSKVCDSQMILSESVCELDDQKCKFGSSTWDECAVDIYSCLRDPAFDICATAPRAC